MISNAARTVGGGCFRLMSRRVSWGSSERRAPPLPVDTCGYVADGAGIRRADTARFRRNRACKPALTFCFGQSGLCFKESPMRMHVRHAAVALALAAGAGAANAQTVITREITNEPVETIVERGPSGTVITRRPLETTRPRVTLPAGPAAAEAVETIETVNRPRETTGSATTIRSV